MIWVILATLGVPLWLCAVGISALLVRNRELRHRPGNMKLRRRREGTSRWTRGYGVWVHDVFAYRGSPAAWAESLVGVRDAVMLVPTEADLKKLRRLGSPPSIMRLTDDDGEHTDFASAPEHALDLLGSFAVTATAQSPESSADA